MVLYSYSTSSTPPETAVTQVLAVRKRYLHVFGPDPAGALPINLTVAIDALPASSGTDLEPYSFWRSETHQAICMLAKRDAARCCARPRAQAQC